MVFAIALNAGVIEAQTLITYGKNTVTKDEFLRAYNKNKPVVTDREKSLREYAELYSNFKLKVRAAQDMRIDTLQQIRYDVENFRGQVIDNYLSDEKGMNRLLDEAAIRATKDIHVLHFSVPVPAGSPAADTMKAYRAIQEMFQELKKGNTDYTELSARISAKYIPAKQSDLGFITVLTVPYDYENIIYNTPVGGYSEPFRSAGGWHIFKVIGERQDIGKWKIAQIMFPFPPAADAETKASIKQKADSVYNLLQSGMAFGAAVRSFSGDKLTYLSDGELQEFGSGTYSSDFESEVLKLSSDGAISRPFTTEYGYHIIRRISHTPVPQNNADETFRFGLKQKIQQDARINQEKEKFARAILTKTGFKRTGNIRDQDLFRDADSLMSDPSVEHTENLPTSKKVIAVFNKGNVKGSDWLKFVREYKANFQDYRGETNQQLWDKYVQYASVNYYKEHLESYSDEFKYQMQEFKEGNMLFEIMERNVWNKAIADSNGLLRYYAAHKPDYKWAASADVIIFNCNTKEIAETAMSALKAGKNWKTVTEENASNMQADSGRYEITQLFGETVKQNPIANNYSAIVVNADGSASFVKYLRLYDGNQQRSFEEAKGLVINDYQTQLEEKWLAELRVKYPVSINQSLLRSLAK
ncbi:MAG: PpiC-type peptidyl-prolyl cis-trans isomerase [Ferruginibacter sp.]|nr:PpiC-type peptidyl-prolyl cis-trans isomerase [Ferruginibacter sp.]